MCYSMQRVQSERDFKGGENVSQQYQDGFGKKKMWKRVKAKAGWKKMEVEEGRLLGGREELPDED